MRAAGLKRLCALGPLSAAAAAAVKEDAISIPMVRCRRRCRTSCTLRALPGQGFPWQCHGPDRRALLAQGEESRMLYELARWLQQLESLFGLFNYQTFRAILAALTALFLSLWLGPAMIRKLAQFKATSRSARTVRRPISPRPVRRPWVAR